MAKQKEGQRVKEFLKFLRELPMIDDEEFKKRHGFSANAQLPRYNDNPEVR